MDENPTPCLWYTRKPGHLSWTTPEYSTPCFMIFMPCAVSSGYLVYFTRPMTMHRAVSPMEPTPRWVPCVVVEMCWCHGQESRKMPGPALELLPSSVSCALSTESLGPYTTGPQQRLLLKQWHHCWQLGLVETSLWACRPGKSLCKIIPFFPGLCQLYQRTTVASLLQWRSVQRLQATCVCTVGAQHAVRRSRSPLAPSTTKKG